jgi:hypothetical protein
MGASAPARTSEGCPPEFAGRPQEAGGNAGPRWMTVARSTARPIGTQNPAYDSTRLPLDRPPRSAASAPTPGRRPPPVGPATSPPPVAALTEFAVQRYDALGEFRMSSPYGPPQNDGLGNPLPPGQPVYGYPQPTPPPYGYPQQPGAAYGYPAGPPPQPGLPPQPGGMLLSLGDIAVMGDSVMTPAGPMPLKGAVWTVTDMSRTEESMPTYAIVLTIIFFLFCLLGLLFLLIKEKKTVGFVQVTVNSGGRYHSTMIPVSDPMAVANTMNQVNYARSLSM